MQPHHATGECLQSLVSRQKAVGQAHAQETRPDAAACASAALRRSLRERSAAAQACEWAAAAACMASIWRSSGRVASGMADASSSWRASAAWPRRVMSASSRFSMSSLHSRRMQGFHSFPTVMRAGTGALRLSVEALCTGHYSGTVCLRITATQGGFVMPGSDLSSDLIPTAFRVCPYLHCILCYGLAAETAQRTAPYPAKRGAMRRLGVTCCLVVDATIKALNNPRAGHPGYAPDPGLHVLMPLCLQTSLMTARPAVDTCKGDSPEHQKFREASHFLSIQGYQELYPA